MSNRINRNVPQPKAASDSRTDESRLAMGNDMVAVKRKQETGLKGKLGRYMGFGVNPTVRNAAMHRKITSIAVPDVYPRR